MPNPITVEIVPRTVPADQQTRAHREQTVRNLADLGQLERPESGQISPTMRDGWVARINGVEFPVYAYGVEQDDDGQPMLSLAFTPDRLVIGDPGMASPSAPEGKPAVASWGSAGAPDPRESIPGWQPESLGEQVARNAQVSA